MACPSRRRSSPLQTLVVLSRKIAPIVPLKNGTSALVGLGWVGEGILTVRFTYRDDVIRIFGAGYWRKGKQIYERENKVHERTSRKPQGRR